MVETPLPPPPPGARPCADLPPPSGPDADPERGPRPVWASSDDASTPPPPPPARAVRSDGPARSVAATVVAAVGALLLLAAAGTFLAVSWDAVPVPARVALIGAATAAAIGGGTVLRRRLPAVGAVVFHLGVVLVPVDVLGLCLQLDAGRATTWLAVGVATATVLPFAGSRGRAPVLGALGLAGVPIVATGAVDAGLLPVAAPVLVAVLAVVVTATGWPGTTAAVRRNAGPALASLAVFGPIVVAMVATITALVGTTGTTLVTATATGWRPARWHEVALAGTIGVLVIAAQAWRARSRRLAILVVPATAAAVLGLVLTGDAPRLALLLPGPVLLVLLGTVAWLLADDELLAGPTRVAATAVEALAWLTVPTSLALAAFVDATRDLEVAAATGVVAVGFAVAALRRPADAVTRPSAAAAAVVTAAAATVLAGAGAPVVAVLLVAAAVAAVWSPAEGRAGIAATAGGVVLGVTGYAATLAADPVGATLGGLDLAAWVAAGVAGLGAVLVAVRLDAHLRSGSDPRTAAWSLLPIHLLAVVVATAQVAGPDGDAVAGLVAVGLLLAAAAVLERVPATGDLLRTLAALVAGVVIIAPGAATPLADAAVAAPAAALAAVLIGIEVARTGRVWRAWLVGPLAVRATAGAVWAASGSEVATGVALLLLAAVAAGVATSAQVRWPAAATGAVAATLGLGLLAVSAHAVAISLIVLGLAAVAVGGLTQVPLVSHGGGVTAVVGAWWLTSLEGVTALDVWAAPLALYVWLAVRPARQDGRVSSWVADVPPLLLVVVPAVVERAAGGPGWHAVVAGALGVVAVIAGGSGRHGGPLIVGTVTVLTVVAVETLAVVAAVPTWAWLTLGGTTLLGAAVLIERTGGAPVEGVRRLQTVLAERFD